MRTILTALGKTSWHLSQVQVTLTIPCATFLWLHTEPSREGKKSEPMSSHPPESGSGSFVKQEIAAAGWGH